MDNNEEKVVEFAADENLNKSVKEEEISFAGEEKKKLFDIDEDVAFKQMLGGNNLGKERAEAIKKASLQKPGGVYKNMNIQNRMKNMNIGPSSFGGNRGFVGVIGTAALFAVGLGLILYFVLKM